MCHHFNAILKSQTTHGLRYCNFQSPRNQTPQRLKTSAFLNLPATWARGGSAAEDENADGERAMCERGGCQGPSQRLACASRRLGGRKGRAERAPSSHKRCPIMTGAERPRRYRQALPSPGGKAVQTSLLVSYTGPNLQAVLLHLGIGRLPLEAHLRQDLRICPSCGVRIMLSLCCFGFGNPLAFVALWFPCSDHIFLSLWLLPLLRDSGPVCLLSTPKLLQICLPSPRGADCQELDSKDFLTDPAVYYTVSKFQKF